MKDREEDKEQDSDAHWEEDWEDNWQYDIVVGSGIKREMVEMLESRLRERLRG